MSLLPLGGRDLGRPLKAPNHVVDVATQLDFDRFVYVASPKLDGNRCLILGGRAYTSSMKPFRNVRLQSYLGDVLNYSAEHDIMLDGELYDIDGTHHADLSGILNSCDGHIPDTMRFCVFDAADMADYSDQCRTMPYQYRIEQYFQHCIMIDPDHRIVIPLKQHKVERDGDASASSWFDMHTHDESSPFGHAVEGVMIRPVNIERSYDGSLLGGWYKHGRSTDRQHIIWKLKSYETQDAVVTAVLPRRVLDPVWLESHEREYDLNGRLKPIKNQDAFLTTECVGAFQVEYEVPSGVCHCGAELDRHTQSDNHGPVEAMRPVETEIGFGRGFDMAERDRLWSIRESLIGRHVEFRHLPHGAMEGGRARHGMLVRFRPDLD
jgi:DNA ligase-1